jgi:hypothetical protein
VNKLIEFLAFVAILYLFDALWEGFRDNKWEKLCKFGWMCLGFTLIKGGVKAFVWAVNL